MANYTNYKIRTSTTLDIDYPTIFNSYVDQSDLFAAELENARNGSDTILSNLQDNYIYYTLRENIQGQYVVSDPDSGYKFTNMAHGTDEADYCTALQAGIALYIAPLSGLDPDTDAPSNFSANSEYRISNDGISIEEFKCKFETPGGSVTNGYPTGYNKSYIQDATGQPTTSVMYFGMYESPQPTPVIGDRFSLIWLFNPSQTVGNQLYSFYGYNLMGGITINLNPGNVFDYVFIKFRYVGGTTGWFIEKYAEAKL